MKYMGLDPEYVSFFSFLSNGYCWSGCYMNTIRMRPISAPFWKQISKSRPPPFQEEEKNNNNKTKQKTWPLAPTEKQRPLCPHLSYV